MYVAQTRAILHLSFCAYCDTGQAKIYERLGFGLRGKTTMEGLLGKFPVYAMMIDSAHLMLTR